MQAKNNEEDSTGASREPWLLRVEQVAKLLNISRSLTYELMSTGNLPSIRISTGCRRIPVGELREWLKHQSQ